jgi:translocation and assembly module TamA
VLAGGSWNLQYLNFFNVNEEVFDDPRNRFFGFQNPYRLNYLEEFVQLDLRDNPIVSRSGVYLAVSGEQGVPLTSTGYHYVKVTPEARAFVPLSAHAVLAARALAGWLEPFGGDQSPITRRYALGGPSNHRGFGLGRLSPELRDSTGLLVPVGGDGQVLFSLEARLAVAQLFGTWLGIIPFVDAGDVTPRFQDLDLAHLNVAVGASLEYRTPIGPLRAGLGVRVNRMGGDNPDPDDRIAFHLTLGEAF